MTRVTTKAIEAAAQAIADEYGHSASMYAADAERALEAALPHLEGVAPAVDREAIEMQIIAATLDGLKGDRDSIDRRVDALMALFGGAQ